MNYLENISSIAHHMDSHTSKSYQELLEYPQYYQRMVILLLHIVSKELYQNTVNIRIELPEKSELDILEANYFGYFGSRILGRMDY